MNTFFSGTRRMVALWLWISIIFPAALLAQPRRTERFQQVLDSLRVAGNYPGLSMAIVFSDNTSLALASGFNDVEKGVPLKPSDRLLQGSVGKTYVAAIAMQQIMKKKIDLNDKVSKYLGHYAWYARVPNAGDITVKMLMNHTSGVMRYEFKPAFTSDLTTDPDKVWNAEELIAYVLDEKPSFEAGKGWEYSDTNYILLGLILEQVTGKKYYELLSRDLLKPLKLDNTLPSNKRKLEGLSQGYAGEGNAFGGQDKVLDAQGLFIINPQFEWTGGGIYSSTLDLALWGKLLYEGKAFDRSLLATMLESVPAKLGKDARYGLGVIIRPTPSLGDTYGHSGFFPGYLTEMIYLPGQQISIALQANSSDFKKIRMRLLNCALRIAETAVTESHGK